MTGAIILPAGVEMIMPGDNVNIDVELITPAPTVWPPSRMAKR